MEPMSKFCADFKSAVKFYLSVDPAIKENFYKIIDSKAFLIFGKASKSHLIFRVYCKLLNSVINRFLKIIYI